MEIEDCYGLAEIRHANTSKRISNFGSKLNIQLDDGFWSNQISCQPDLHVTLNQTTLRVVNCNQLTQYQLDFKSAFRMICSSNDGGSSKVSIGIEMKLSPQNQIKLYHFEQHILRKWQEALSKIIARRGFYEDYTPVQKLGKGKTAEVYLAIRNDDSKKFAVKSFSKAELQQSERSLKGLQNQVKILRTLKNKYLLKFYALYETERSYYLICQYIEGRTLKDFISQQTITIDQANKLILQIAYGLKYLAKHDIAHRDIKPDNIMIRAQTNQPVIVDFGLATKCNIDQYIFTRCGTPGYIAPQVFEGDAGKICPLVDIFSLGIIYHILVWKQYPYNGKGYKQILIENERAKFNFDSQLYQGYSSEAVKLIKRMLSRLQNQRISATSVINLLEDNNNNQENYYTKMLCKPNKEVFYLENSAVSTLDWKRNISKQKLRLRRSRILKQSIKNI